MSNIISPKNWWSDRDLRIILTKDCNYRCTFCHQEGVSHQLSKTLAPDDYVFLYDVIKHRQWIEWVTLTGWEPLMYNQIYSLSKNLKEHWAKITMVTNGSLLDKNPEIGENLNRINISLHSLKQNEYQDITRTRIKIDHILANIALMKKNHPNLIIRLNATIVKWRNDNPRDIEAMIDVADKYGLSIKFVELYPNTDPDFVPLKSIEDILEDQWFEKYTTKPRQSIFQRWKRTIVLAKIFCWAAVEYNDPEEFCRQENDLFITPDGWISQCPVNIQNISVYDAIKQRNIWQLHDLLSKVNNEPQKSCVLKAVH